MKKHTYILFSLSILVVTIVCTMLSSCGGGDDESTKDKNLKLLKPGTWTMTNVTVDGVNKNDLFTGFTLTFADKTYTAVNGDPVWPTSGTWSFTDDKANKIVRDDGVVVSILTLTETNLELALEWQETTLGSGRKNSVKGEHIFQFSK